MRQCLGCRRLPVCCVRNASESIISRNAFCNYSYCKMLFCYIVILLYIYMYTQLKEHKAICIQANWLSHRSLSLCA